MTTQTLIGVEYFQWYELCIKSIWAHFKGGLVGRQTFRGESNWKHEPHAEHYVDDKFEKGTKTRNWKKKIDKQPKNKKSKG